MKTDRKVFESPSAVVEAAAEMCTRIMLAAVQQRGRALVLLSGGSTPKALYLLLSDPDKPFRERLPWAKLHFFLGDERCVPPQDANSNFRMAQESLFSRAGLPESNAHRMLTELGAPETIASDYEKQFEQFFARTPEDGPPIFDLVLLGLGTDGHTASLFPDVAYETESKKWVQSFWVPSLSTHRISVMPSVLKAGRNLVGLAVGKEKAEAVDWVLSESAPARKVPAREIKPTYGALVWLVDEAAVLN